MGQMQGGPSFEELNERHNGPKEDEMPPLSPKFWEEFMEEADARGELDIANEFLERENFELPFPMVDNAGVDEQALSRKKGDMTTPQEPSGATVSADTTSGRSLERTGLTPQQGKAVGSQSATTPPPPGSNAPASGSKRPSRKDHGRATCVSCGKRFYMNVGRATATQCSRRDCPGNPHGFAYTGEKKSSSTQ